ncbi:MAG TPA: hypothetical protein VL990_03370 [Acidobacteriaceae bacterium]|nr:hypothetical protein [Acidobacteriaceae bacterium]
MRLTFVPAVLVCLSFVPIAYGQTKKPPGFAGCPVTIPRTSPEFVKDAIDIGNAYWSGNLYAGAFWPDGTVPIGPRSVGSILPDGSLQMKYAWFRAAGLTGRLTITGRRLDAEAPPLKADIPNGYLATGFQASALIFPTEGCWEITGKVADTTLTFVNRVIRAE